MASNEMRVRPATAADLAKAIEKAHPSWTQTLDVAKKAMAFFETPKRRQWAADFLNIAQVQCI